MNRWRPPKPGRSQHRYLRIRGSVIKFRIIPGLHIGPPASPNRSNAEHPQYFSLAEANWFPKENWLWEEAGRPCYPTLSSPAVQSLGILRRLFSRTLAGGSQAGPIAFEHLHERVHDIVI